MFDLIIRNGRSRLLRAAASPARPIAIGYPATWRPTGDQLRKGAMATATKPELGPHALAGRPAEGVDPE